MIVFLYFASGSPFPMAVFWFMGETKRSKMISAVLYIVDNRRHRHHIRFLSFLFLLFFRQKTLFSSQSLRNKMSRKFCVKLSLFGLHFVFCGPTRARRLPCSSHSRRVLQLQITAPSLGSRAGFWRNLQPAQAGGSCKPLKKYNRWR